MEVTFTFTKEELELLRRVLRNAIDRADKDAALLGKAVDCLSDLALRDSCAQGLRETKAMKRGCVGLMDKLERKGGENPGGV